MVLFNRRCVERWIIVMSEKILFILQIQFYLLLSDFFWREYLKYSPKFVSSFFTMFFKWIFLFYLLTFFSLIKFSIIPSIGIITIFYFFIFEIFRQNLHKFNVMRCISACTLLIRSKQKFFPYGKLIPEVNERIQLMFFKFPKLVLNRATLTKIKKQTVLLIKVSNFH